MTALLRPKSAPVRALYSVDLQDQLRAEARYQEVSANYATAKQHWHEAIAAGDAEAEQRFLTEMDSASVILDELGERFFGRAA